MTTQTKRRYLTKAKVDALLELAGYGEDYVAGQIDDLLRDGDLEREDLDHFERRRYDKLNRLIDLGREARQIIVSRGGVRLS